jgi:hypothetical protein
MRYLFFALALLGGISFGAVAYAAGTDNGNDNHGMHNGDCMSEANIDAGNACDDPSQTPR